MISLTNKILSKILFPFINPAFSLEINFGRNFLILFWIILQNILFTKLLKEIGYRSKKFWAISFFGSKTKFVWVANLVNSAPLKKNLNFLQILSRTILMHLDKMLLSFILVHKHYLYSISTLLHEPPHFWVFYTFLHYLYPN